MGSFSQSIMSVYCRMPNVFFIIFSLVIIGASGDCPHPKYLHDHVCSDCHTAEQALEFSRKKWSPSGVNTVLVLDENKQVEDNYKLVEEPNEVVCLSRQPATIIWQCRTDRGYCNVMHRNMVCTFYHADRNGHFFYNRMADCQQTSSSYDEL